MKIKFLSQKWKKKSSITELTYNLILREYLHKQKHITSKWLITEVCSW